MPLHFQQTMDSPGLLLTMTETTQLLHSHSLVIDWAQRKQRGL